MLLHPSPAAKTTSHTQRPVIAGGVKPGEQLKERRWGLQRPKVRGVSGSWRLSPCCPLGKPGSEVCEEGVWGSLWDFRIEGQLCQWLPVSLGTKGGGSGEGSQATWEPAEPSRG